MAGVAGRGRTNRGIKMNKAVRRVIEVSVAGVVLALLSAHSGDAASAGTQAAAKPIAIKVYKTPQCGCCTHTFNGIPFTQRFNPVRTDDPE